MNKGFYISLSGNVFSLLDAPRPRTPPKNFFTKNKNKIKKDNVEKSLHSILKEDVFERFVIRIQNKKQIEQANQFGILLLKQTKRKIENPFNRGKLLFSTLMLSKFPKEFFNKPYTKLENILLSCSIQIRNILKEFFEGKGSFEEASLPFFFFCQFFVLWKKKDKEILTKSLIKVYRKTNKEKTLEKEIERKYLKEQLILLYGPKKANCLLNEKMHVEEWIFYKKDVHILHEVFMNEKCKASDLIRIEKGGGCRFCWKDEEFVLKKGKEIDILLVVSYIRESYLSMVKGSFKVFISEALDETVIKEQIRSKKFSFEEFQKTVLNIGSKLCAPVRDSEIEILLNIKDENVFFQKLFIFLCNMKKDLLTFHISVLRKEILSKGASYENETFWSNKEILFEETIKFLKESQKEKESDMIIELFCKAVFDPENNIFETLYFDIERLFELNRRIEVVSILNTLFFILKKKFKTSVLKDFLNEDFFLCRCNRKTDFERFSLKFQKTFKEKPNDSLSLIFHKKCKTYLLIEKRIKETIKESIRKKKIIIQRKFGCNTSVESLCKVTNKFYNQHISIHSALYSKIINTFIKKRNIEKKDDKNVFN